MAVNQLAMKMALADTMLKVLGVTIVLGGAALTVVVVRSESQGQSNAGRAADLLKNGVCTPKASVEELAA